MPYKPEHQRVLDLAIRPALEAAGISATLVKDEQYVGPVFERIQAMITESLLCIADVTGGNPNVMWEAAYGEALGKPIVFIAQGSAEAIPFNIRQNRCILYDLTPAGLSTLQHDITHTIRSITAGETSDLQLLRQMLLPRSIAEVPAPFVVASSPLSYRMAYRGTGWKKRPPKTYSDYVGIRGLMRAFGLTLAMQVLPELVSPDDFADEALDRAMHLYAIGSPKANRWSGIIMERFFAGCDTKWDFKPDPESDDLRNVKVVLRVNGKPYLPVRWKETHSLRKDFGIVLRGPNTARPGCMITVLAGRSALGTEAAALGVTDPDCARKLMREIVHRQIDPEDHRQAFCAVVSVECIGTDAEMVTASDTFTVWDVQRC
jgi:hypothetical protein